ncbi:hypothetical protein EVAR_66758_1 [Eumeta japonica]|uniref:Uncharacterized protein n=1 Tax=Eumeta variegata TaxID=151549 RepID=A0A4C1Z976_EUMVA|nr:hypothetical protein EVAR_66758_1 [Eumeta japonica]
MVSSRPIPRRHAEACAAGRCRESTQRFLSCQRCLVHWGLAYPNEGLEVCPTATCEARAAINKSEHQNAVHPSQLYSDRHCEARAAINKSEHQNAVHPSQLYSDRHSEARAAIKQV